VNNVDEVNKILCDTLITQKTQTDPISFFQGTKFPFVNRERAIIQTMLCFLTNSYYMTTNKEVLETRKSRRTIFLDQIYGSGKTRFGVEFLGPNGVKRVRSYIVDALQDNAKHHLSKIAQTEHEHYTNKDPDFFLDYCTKLLDDIIERTHVVHIDAPLTGTKTDINIMIKILLCLDISFIDDMDSIIMGGPAYFVNKIAQVGKNFFIVIDELSPKIEEVRELWAFIVALEEWGFRNGMQLMFLLAGKRTMLPEVR
jgi:hypothetical protein